jgi:hypothetical protein
MKGKATLSLLALAAVVLAAGMAGAQMPKPEDVVTVRVEPLAVKGKAGDALAATVLATVKDGFHVNSNQPTLEYLIPTRVELPALSLFDLEKAEYPEGELKAFGFAPDEKLSVYEGVVRVPVRLRAKDGVPAGAHDLRLIFHYQACNDRLCLRPAKHEVALKVLLR